MVMDTLKELVMQYGANGFVFADAGNGCGFGEEGQFVSWDERTAEEYGDIELSPISKPHYSIDKVECNYASDWIGMGEGDNPYRYKIYF